MPQPQPQQAPPPRMRPHPPPPILRHTINHPHTEGDAHKTDLGTTGRKTRPRRRGRRAGTGNKAKAQASLAARANNQPSPGMTFHNAAPPRSSTPGISRSSTPTNNTPDGYSTPTSGRDTGNGRHEIIFAHLERLERLEAAKPTLHTEVPLITPPQTAASCSENWPSAARTHQWPPTRSLSPTLGRASRRPAYIGSHLPIATLNLPETKPFPLGTPDFGEIERKLPTAYNADYPHPLTVYASPAVNPAAIAASGYAPLLRELQETDPRAAMGGILADCGNEQMVAPALLLAPGNKDGCGIPERLWLQLSTLAGVKVPIGAVLPALMAGRGVSPRFVQASSPATSPHPEQASLTPPPSRSGMKPDAPESPLYSIFAKAQRVALTRAHKELTEALDDHNSTLASQVSALYKRRGSLPDLRLGAKRKADLLTGHDDERSQLFSLVSPRRLERRATDEDLIRELLSGHCVVEAGLPDSPTKMGRLPDSPTKMGRLPRLPSRRLSLSFDSLSTVEETDDDTRGSTGGTSPYIEPIGAERNCRGQLPRLPLYQHRPVRGVDESYTPRTPLAASRPASSRPSTAPSTGAMSGLVSPPESMYHPLTPPSTGDVFSDVFSDVRYSSRSSSSEDEFTLAPNATRSKFLSGAGSKHVIHDSPPSSPTERRKGGFLPRRAWFDPPVSSTTLDFSTGKSIWK